MKLLKWISDSMVLASLWLATSPAMAGNGTSGGANLLNGRPIESYRVAIEKTPEMQTALALMIALGNLPWENVPRVLEFITKEKAWYIAPIDLPTLSKEMIGVAFDPEQGALQDFEEVWIEQRPYNKMTFNERVELFAHELFMGLKILNFDSYARQCQVAQPFNIDCTRLAKHKERATLKISSEEYKNIRRVTGLVMANRPLLARSPWELNQDASVTALRVSIFGQGSFDSQFVKPSAYPNGLVEFSQREILDSLQDQKSVGQLPRFCAHEIVKELGDHRYLMRARAVADYSVKRSGDKLQISVDAKSLSDHKTVLRHTYALKFDLAKKENLTLDNDSIANRSYPWSTFVSVDGKQIGITTVAVTKGMSVESLAFATFPARSGKAGNSISLHEATDLLKCIDRNEFVCEGFHCLDSSPLPSK